MIYYLQYNLIPIIIHTHTYTHTHTHKIIFNNNIYSRVTNRNKKKKRKKDGVPIKLRDASEMTRDYPVFPMKDYPVG